MEMSSTTIQRVSNSDFSDIPAVASPTKVLIAVQGPCVVKGLFWQAADVPGTLTPIVATLKKYTRATGALALTGVVLTTASPPVAGRIYYKITQLRIAVAECAVVTLTGVPTAGQGILSMEVELDGFHTKADIPVLIASTT
jgi:hypothetical protein